MLKPIDAAVLLPNDYLAVLVDDFIIPARVIDSTPQGAVVINLGSNELIDAQAEDLVGPVVACAELSKAIDVADDNVTL